MDSSRSISRRDVLQAGAGLAAAGVFGDAAVAAEAPKSPGLYESLGLKPVVNATGTITALLESLVRPGGQGGNGGSDGPR